MVPRVTGPYLSNQVPSSISCNPTGSPTKASLTNIKCPYTLYIFDDEAINILDVISSFGIALYSTVLGELGEIRYLIVDARYEKARLGGVVRDVAVLSAIDIGPDERRRVLGVSCALSEAEIHWRAFLKNLLKRGMHGVQFVVSDDHSDLQAARKAVLGGAVMLPIFIGTNE
jgi:hypothetical protein